MRSELRYLDSLQGSGIRPGLGRVKSVLRALGDPQKRYATIIVAGTNGKGSTAATLSSILRASGYRTGLYTSPHLVSIAERWQIDGIPATTERIAESIRRMRTAAELMDISPTYFEALTLIAFDLFCLSACEVAVIEVGLGGRLDATNVTRPVAALITPIGFDHMEYLGNTIRSIAREKAGVIHRGAVALTSNEDEIALGEIARRAASIGSELFVTAKDSDATAIRNGERLTFRLATPSESYRLSSPLVGTHQVSNVILAVRAAEELRPLFDRISRRSIVDGVSTTSWRGRLELFRAGEKRLWVDGAHNAHAAKRVAEFIGSESGRRRTLVFGIMGDKDVHDVASLLFPLFDRIVLTEPPSDRAMDPEKLAALARSLGILDARVIRNVTRAIQSALDDDSNDVLICGSLYLAGSAIERLDRMKIPSAMRSVEAEKKSAIAVSTRRRPNSKRTT